MSTYEYRDSMLFSGPLLIEEPAQFLNSLSPVYPQGGL